MLSRPLTILAGKMLAGALGHSLVVKPAEVPKVAAEPAVLAVLAVRLARQSH